MKASILLIALLATLISCAPNKEPLQEKPDTTLRLSTLNLKFFGSGGGFYKKGVEPRKKYLVSYIQQELNTSDAILFSEVVDVTLLKKSVQNRWDCVSYDDDEKRSRGWHQFLVFCYDGLKFRVEKYDEDFVVPEHALGSRGLRPALQLRLCHKDGDCFAQVLGVHLKAGRETPKRVQQIETLAVELSQQSIKLPTILAGDFNSYSKERSGFEQDDIEVFESQLSQSGQTFRSLAKNLGTFSTGETSRSYDHIMVSDEIKATDVKAYSACSKSVSPDTQVIDYASFRKNFTDHCYVTATLQIPTP